MGNFAVGGRLNQRLKTISHDDLDKTFGFIQYVANMRGYCTITGERTCCFLKTLPVDDLKTHDIL